MSPPHPALLHLASGRPVGMVADEGSFLLSASEHRMVATVIAAEADGTVRLSPDSMTSLAIEDLAEHHRHLKLWSALGQIQATLSTIGAEVAVLKGIATEARWYDGVGQRVCTDLDLLLDPGSPAGAATVVAALDPRRGCSEAIDWLVRRRLLQHVDLRFGDVPVDLHLDPLKIGIPTVQLDAVWDSTEVHQLPHGRIRVLSAEVELVLLLLHMNKDGFALLGTFVDIQRLVGRASLDWDRLRRFVADEGLDVPVWKSLGVVEAIVGLDTTEAPTVRGLRAWTWDRLWGHESILGGAIPRDQRRSVQPLLALHASGRGADNLRELRRQVAPHRPLLEVAGMLEPGQSYLRQVGIERVRKRRRRRAVHPEQGPEA